MSHYKPYPAYLDSGVEWLGKVPEHWGLSPLKHLVSKIESGTSVNATDTPAAQGERGVLKTSCVYSGKFDPAENKAILPEEYDRATCPLVVGSLIVSRMNTPDLVGAAGLVSLAPEGVFLPDRLWQVSFLGVNSSFAYYWSQSASYRAQVKMVCTGTSSSMQNLSQDQFKDFFLGVPERDEQQAIAAHLDRETARIDALVEKKTSFIKLLREKRQALITYVVTKGLDPNVKMKDSGVEWLGDVPEHWQVTTVSRLFEIKAGGDLKEEFFSDLQDEAHCYPIYTNSVKLDAVYGYTSKAFYLPNTISVSGRGEIGHAVYRENAYDAIIRLLVLTPKSRKHCKYSAYFINAVLDFHGGSTAVSQLSAEQIAPYLMLNPSDKEQIEISKYLDHETSRIDTLINKTERSVGLLKERRSALITAAVIGQIDLRGAV